VFRSSNDSCTRNRYPVSRPSRHINSLAGHTSPLAGGRAPFCLNHDECLEIRCATPFRNISFLLFLSLSISPQGSGNRIFRRSPSQRRKQAPSPPTDQGFEGCTLRGSATAPEHSGSEPFTDQGSKAGPSKGFDSRPKTCRVRDDPGYVRYMAKAWAMLPRYPRTFPRPAETIL
jgi:hypothetical protein